MIKILRTVLSREFSLAFRAKQELLNPLVFFLIVTSLFPLAISPDVKVLHLIAPGVIWVAALLATLMSLDKLFKNDLEDGSLEQLVLSGQSLEFIAVAKVLSYWLLISVPLIFITPLIGLMFSLSIHSMTAMVFSLLLGTPTLCFLGAIGSALTVGLRNSGILLTLLVLPFYIPVLIFGTNTVVSAMAGLPYHGQLTLLGAFLILALTLSPFAIAASLRISVNY